MPSFALRLSFLVLLAASSCRAFTPSRLEGMLKDTIETMETRGGTGVLKTKDAEKLLERYTLVRTWYAEGRLESAEDCLYASLILVTSNQEDDLVAAVQLAVIAGEAGAAESNRVQAEAIDKLAIAQSRPQRFGTQYAYSPVLQKWQHYPVDPKTTDQMRAIMGVPPLRVLQQRVELLNRRLEATKAARAAKE